MLAQANPSRALLPIQPPLNRSSILLIHQRLQCVVYPSRLLSQTAGMVFHRIECQPQFVLTFTALDRILSGPSVVQGANQEGWWVAD